MKALTDVIPIVAASAAFLAGALAVSIKGNRFRAAWSVLSIGIGFFLLGEITWAIQEIFYKIYNPFPSISDIFWLTGYIPLLIGLILAWRAAGVNLTKKEIIAISVGAVAVLLISSLFVLFPIVTSSKIGVVEKSLDVAYPLGDLVLLIPAVALVLIFDRTLIGRPWQFICLGLIFISAADIGFSYLTWHKIYWMNINDPGNMVDLLWTAGYLAISLGAVEFAKITAP